MSFIEFKDVTKTYKNPLAMSDAEFMKEFGIED